MEGYLYCHGPKQYSNPKKGIKLLKEAAKRREPFAMTELGICYLSGSFVKKDPKKAFEYFQKSAQEDPKACYMLGECYEKGAGVEKDVFEALVWYRRTALRKYAPAAGKLHTMGYHDI